MVQLILELSCCYYLTLVSASLLVLTINCIRLNRLLPKSYDRNKQPKRPLSLEKLTYFPRKLSNFGTFLKLTMFLISQIPLGTNRVKTFWRFLSPKKGQNLAIIGQIWLNLWFEKVIYWLRNN